MSYSELVLRHFAKPRHAGDPGSRYPLTVTAEAREPGDGCHLRFTAALEDGTLACLRYRVFGCPHLLAAAEETCRALEGRPLDELAAPAVTELMARLDVPVEKTGRLLLLEDAVGALLEAIDRERKGVAEDK